MRLSAGQLAHWQLPEEMDKRTDKERAHIYEVRPRKDKRGVDLISDALPFGRL
jgi:hypothetical protein